MNVQGYFKSLKEKRRKIMADLSITKANSEIYSRTKLKINSNIEISNFKSSDIKPSDFFQAKIVDGEVTIQSDKENNKSSLDLSNEMYGVILKIARSSKDDSGAEELSWYDLRDTDKEKLGLDDSFVVKKDLAAGILNIYKKVGDKLTTWLHIDFEMPSEKVQNGNENQSEFQSLNENVNSSKVKTAVQAAWNDAKQNFVPSVVRTAAALRGLHSLSKTGVFKDGMFVKAYELSEGEPYYDDQYNSMMTGGHNPFIHYANTVYLPLAKMGGLVKEMVDSNPGFNFVKSLYENLTK